MNGSETQNLWNFTRLEKFSDRWTDAVVGEASFTFGGVARRRVGPPARCARNRPAKLRN